MRARPVEVLGNIYTILEQVRGTARHIHTFRHAFVDADFAGLVT